MEEIEIIQDKMNDYHSNWKQNEGAPDSWCPLPWSHINIQINGTYKVCCHSSNGTIRDKDRKPFRCGEVSWNNVMNSDIMKSIRKNMLRGEWASECTRCQQQFNSGMRGANILSRHKLAKDVESKNHPGYLKTKTLTKTDGSISLKDFPISFPDIRFSNLCNLKCVTCGPDESNSWYKDHQQIFGKNNLNHNVEEQMNENSRKNKREEEKYVDLSSNYWSQIEEHIHSFRRIYISGGEPLLMKPYYKFLKKCIENKVAGKITIEFNSNMTHLPPQIYDLWRQFKEIHVGASLDGFGNIHNYMRYPGKWHHIEKNMLQTDNGGEHLKCHIGTTVSVLNIWHLPQFIEYIMNKNYKKFGSSLFPVVSHCALYIPVFLNLNILEESFKEKIRIRFEKYKIKFSNYDWQSAHGTSHLHSWEEKVMGACKILDNYIKFMKQISYHPEELTKWRSHFIYYMDKLDELRKTTWPSIFPELYTSTLAWRKLKQPERWSKYYARL